MIKLEKQISASEFKKHFLSLVDDVKNKHSSFIITKRKIPVAKIVPLDNDRKTYFGSIKGVVKINDDIINHSVKSDWEINDD